MCLFKARKLSFPLSLDPFLLLGPFSSSLMESLTLSAPEHKTRVPTSFHPVPHSSSWSKPSQPVHVAESVRGQLSASAPVFPFRTTLCSMTETGFSLCLGVSMCLTGIFSASVLPTGLHPLLEPALHHPDPLSQVTSCPNSWRHVGFLSMLQCLPLSFHSALRFSSKLRLFQTFPSCVLCYVLSAS